MLLFLRIKVSYKMCYNTQFNNQKYSLLNIFTFKPIDESISYNTCMYAPIVSPKKYSE